MEPIFYTVTTIVLGWLGWRNRGSLETFARNLVQRFSRSGPPPPNPRTTPNSPTSGAGETIDDAAATVVAHRGSFGSITCVSGMLLGQRWDIPGHGLSIGRDPDSDVVVNDTRVSANHAQIRPRQGEIVVVDAGSRNGVFLNDFQHRVAGEASLKPGDLFMLSATDAAHFIYRK